MGFLSKFEGKMEDTLEGAADRMVKSPISPVQIAKKAEKKMRREKMVGAGKQYAPTLYTVLVNPDDDERLFGYYPTLAGETETYLAAKAAEEGLVMDGQPLVRFIVDEGLRHGKFDVIAEAVAAPLVAQLRQEEMERYGLAGAPGGAYGTPGNAAGAYGTPYAPPAGGMRGGYAAAGASPHANAAPEPYAAAPYGNAGYADPNLQAAPYGDAAAPYDYGYADAPDPRNGASPYADPYSSPYAEPYADADPYGDIDTPTAQSAFGSPHAPGAGTPGGKPPLPYVPEDEIDYSIDYGEYTFDSRNFEDYRENAAQDAAFAGSPEGHEGFGGAGGPGNPEGFDVPAGPNGRAGGYGAAAAVPGAMGAAAGAGAGASWAAGHAGAAAASADRAAPAAANTVVFAAGAGAATPQPSAGAVRARLVDTTNNRTYALASARLLIGRESSCDIALPDINVSRTHAELRFEPQGAWSLTDLGSTNGTFVNGREISSHLLSEGDRITVGMTSLVFERA